MAERQMLFSLRDGEAAVRTVGGKSASLMKLYSTEGISQHVPSGFALSVDFFNPWVDDMMASAAWKDAEPKLVSTEAPSVCQVLKRVAKELRLSPQQAQILETLRTAIKSWPGQLAAVRSSAPEEDGSGASFAGIFETKLGVVADTLEDAVRECFASVFDHRVFSYAGVHRPAFAAVVMEMVDSHKAGVAFSANPLNSDLDEMVVDSSWGLGESVVDGSVVADRFVWDKVLKNTVEQTVGSKLQERRLLSNGGVEVRSVDEARQAESTLSADELAQLAHLVALVETTYGLPMDTEWAYTENGQLRLLQARPITTIYPMDPDMLTKPGEPRFLYYDPNIASEATTISAFTHMDLTAYMELAAVSMGIGELSLPRGPNHLYFDGATRQYLNLSHMFRIPGCSPEGLAKEMDLVDPYLASIFRGDECSKAKYKSARLPPDCTFRNTWSLLRKIPVRRMMKQYNKFKKDPIRSNLELQDLRCQFDARLKELKARRPTDQGLRGHCNDICRAAEPVLDLQMGAIWKVVGVMRSIDQVRRQGKTEKEREEADALCGGFVGDPLMGMNIDMYHLARKLPVEIWNEYAGKFKDLAERIAQNVAGGASDLPKPFVESWREFMDKHGYDGTDQLFVSSPRYHEQPELLLVKICHNIGDIKDPSQTLQERLARRQEVQEAQERDASILSRRRIRKRNTYLDHIMWLRNAPKLLMSEMFAAIRSAVLAAEVQLLATGRLDEPGDVFHLKIVEVDQALQDPAMDLRQILAPRKKQYLRAKQAKTCPFVIDSRCRILKANVVKSELGTLVGAAISPGVATGIVRVLTSPNEYFETGEVLATIVTDPAWTPLFVGCSAVILQVGGALQHGALCAREYGKPAVSGILVMTELKTGMAVSVDGNTGVVKILDGREGINETSDIRAPLLENAV
jgi:pyruvate,water dikinase